MSGEERLAALFAAFRDTGIECLVMGGHAVRYYGVDRSTIDYDFHAAMDADAWNRLPSILDGLPVFTGAPVVEGPSWRPSEFRRFVIGRLPGGGEERLELWRGNHLLAPFSQLHARREEGSYGGGVVAFLGIQDLIRSKQTEREDDWRDVSLLEEIADDRAFAAATDDEAKLSAIARLRSRRGYELAVRSGLLEDAERLQIVVRTVDDAITLAYLAPHLRETVVPADDTAESLRQLLHGPLRRVAPGSLRHLALVEAARRLHRAHAMALDRQDKERAVGERR